MKKQGNFFKAVEELLNGKIMDSEKEAAELDEASDPENDLQPEPATSPDEDASEKIQPSLAANPKTVSVRRVGSRDVEAVITEDMVVKGNISSTANISISGTILGDVSSEGDVVVKGKVEGNVTVRSLSVEGGKISGDITSSGVVTIAENSSVEGNIKAERIEVNGRITGNLDSASKVVLNPHSMIEGNVTALELSMIEGAELKGTMNVHKEA
ncbi:MAG TPA: polymer-forming cytoskeletal protein [Rectinemataceae bacterium]|nr:polymer-forming cytoskeletal protein [Rectinemataceae bacterium]